VQEIVCASAAEVDVVKETTMGWISRFRASERAEPAAPWGETVINGAWSDSRNVIRSNPEDPPASGDRSGAHIAGEIKRRQIALALRYVAAVRAR
jgi:hypothetical protein